MIVFLQVDALADVNIDVERMARNVLLRYGYDTHNLDIDVFNALGYCLVIAEVCDDFDGYFKSICDFII